MTHKFETLGLLSLLICPLFAVSCASSSPPGPPSLPKAPSAPAPPSPPSLPTPTPTPARQADAQDPSAQEETSPSDEAISAPPGPPVPQGAPTDDERQAELDSKLQTSLAEFDQLMQQDREEMDRRRAQAPATDGGFPGSRGSGGSGDYGDGRFGEEEAEFSQADGPEAGEQETGEQEATDPGEEDAEDRQATQGGVAGEETDAGGTPRVPSDIPDGDDDDIVARQLREAAMAEKDSKLRERLWQEYRDYRSGTRRKREDSDAEPETSP